MSRLSDVLLLDTICLLESDVTWAGWPIVGQSWWYPPIRGPVNISDGDTNKVLLAQEVGSWLLTFWRHDRAELWSPWDMEAANTEVITTDQSLNILIVFKVLLDYILYFCLHIIHVFVLSGCKSPVFPIFQPSYYWARRIARLMTNLDKTFMGLLTLNTEYSWSFHPPMIMRENISQCANIILRHDQWILSCSTQQISSNLELVIFHPLDITLLFYVGWENKEIKIVLIQIYFLCVSPDLAPCRAWCVIVIGFL